MRSLLRWLHLTGTIPVPLAAAVPSVAGWRLSGLPKGLEPGQLRILLDACDRRTPTGLRGYAIMLLLARLGLRAGEVARLGLDDDRLRHTAATAMLRAGRPLAEVGQVLRHRSVSTTAIYAKVDRDALAVPARPWPVTASDGVSNGASGGAGRRRTRAPSATW